MQTLAQGFLADASPSHCEASYNKQGSSFTTVSIHGFFRLFQSVLWMHGALALVFGTQGHGRTCMLCFYALLAQVFFFWAQGRNITNDAGKVGCQQQLC